MTFENIILIALVFILLVINLRNGAKISFYESWLERLDRDAGIKLPKVYDKVKNDFWMWLKSFD